MVEFVNLGEVVDFTSPSKGGYKMTSPFLRIDHVSIAAADHQKAEDFYLNVLGAIPCASDKDPVTKYYWQNFSLGDLSRIELLTPTAQGSFLDGFLEKGGGVHHITLQTSNLEEAKAHLERHNVPYFGEHAYPDFLWKEIFIHPRHAFGILIQIAEFHAEEWLSEQVKLAGNSKWKIHKSDEGIRIELAHPGGGIMNLNLTREEARRLAQELLE